VGTDASSGIDVDCNDGDGLPTLFSGSSLAVSSSEVMVALVTLHVALVHFA
jgi:hypothetical protein